MIIRHVTKPSHAEILQMWDNIEKHNPGISVEQLIARICDWFKHEVDSADIAEALSTLPRED
jgi:hypothetical protein